MFMRACAAMLALWIVMPTGTAQARESWVLVGTSEVDLSKSSGDVDVSKARGAFKAVRVEAKRQGINLTGVRIIFADGSKRDENRAIHLLKGERSKPVDFGGAAEFVDRVDFNFNSNAGAGSPARLEIWALQTDDGRRALRGGNVAAIDPGRAQDNKPTDAKPGERTEGGDVMFGYQDVGFGMDTDTIRVGSENGKFSRLRLRVLKNDVYVNSLKVVYVDGTSEELAVNAQVRQGARSQWYDVNASQFIREIQLLYRSRPNFSGQARVEVTGQYAPDWLGATGEGRKYNEGWVLLGAQSAGMFGVNTIKAFGFDRDVIPVGKNEGGFKKIRIKVRNRSITLKSLRVVYYNGPDTMIDRRTRVDPDQIEGPWEVKADAPIKEIVASYRGRIVWGKGTGIPVVEIWGQH